jgi:two-component system sensor histidine kinase BaeS
MRRRITIVILATVALSLLLAGLGTVVLARWGARRAAESQVRDEVESVAALIDAAAGTRVATRIPNTARQRPIAIVSVTADGRVDGTLPAGVEPRFLDGPALRDQQTISGPVGGSTFAAARAITVPSDSGAALQVVVAARPVELIGGALPWFLVSSAVALAVAVVAATWVSRRLVAPVREATIVTARIAGGDLTARLPEPPVPTDEVDELARSVNAMAGALEQSRGLERQFLLSVSHDLRTPLTSIRGYAEAITDGAATDPQEAAAIILSESRRLERLVTDLLDLGMLDARQFTFHPRVVDLREVAEDVVDGFRFGQPRDGVAVSFAGAAEPVTVSIDPERLQQAAANLIENAIRYARSAVRVEVVSDGAWAHLSVIDDGPGIDPATLPLVFNRAWSGRGSSGLGLAIVRELVVAMGGAVDARAEPAGGARLLISLPAAP